MNAKTSDFNLRGSPQVEKEILTCAESDKISAKSGLPLSVTSGKANVSKVKKVMRYAIY